MASMRQLESGNWQAHVRRRGLKPAAKSFENKVDAYRWARMLESEIDRGVFLDRSGAERTTVAELIDRYLREVTPLKKSAPGRGTAERAEAAIRGLFLRSFA